MGRKRLACVLGAVLSLAGPFAHADAPGVSFFTPKARLWQGRSQVILFQIPQPATQDRFYSFNIDEKLVHLLIPPQVLNGEKTGFLRVESRAEGRTQLVIDGAKLDLEIVPDRATSFMTDLHPQIVEPAAGAQVWGEFAVGVEQLDMHDATQLPLPVLRLPGGKEIAGQVVPNQKASPHARWVFTVNSDDLIPGSNALVAISKDGNGREIRGEPVFVNVIRPEATSALTGLCKDGLGGDRPGNTGQQGPKISDDAKFGPASIVDDTNEGQTWCLPVWVPKKGQYQLFVTARGDMGGDALPTIGLTIDEEYQPQTTGRLATTDWQRIPVGHPISLDDGGHYISVRMRNGFAQGPEDMRRLFLQKYELVRIDPSVGEFAMNDAGMGAGAGPSQKVGRKGAKKLQRGSEPVHVAFADNIDGQIVTGIVDVRARCSWPDHDHSPPPRVELYVNDKLVGMQSSPGPHFSLDPAALSPGANVLKLRAVALSGTTAESVPLTVQMPADFPRPQHAFRPALNFTTYDSGLASSMQPPLPQGDRDVATFYANAESTVDLPNELAGTYNVVVVARGDAFQGPAQVRVGLKSGGPANTIGEVPVGPKMGPVPIGKVEIKPGAKQLTVAFTNDAYEKDKGDRNLYVRAVRLVPVETAPDTQPPVAAISLAPKTIGLRGVDAVVARVMDDRRVASADLLIDNQPQHLDQTAPLGLGAMVLPVLTRDLKPGKHTLKVIATDDAKNQGASAETTFTLSATATTAPSKYQRALFLLNRLGYGPEPREIAAILTMGEKPWLESRLAQEEGTPAEKNEQEMLRAQFPDRHDGGQVMQGAVEYLLTEPNPVRARFVMWAENHFSTWLTKDRPSAKAIEHENFLHLGPVPFYDLLFTSATSPAMLFYLDQQHSYKHRLNENYAREIMELHTLGVKGGYTQKDVTTLADLLTGWTLAEQAPADGAGGELDRFFGYDPNLNSGTACRVFGVEFPGVEPEKRFDRVLMALEFLSAHPSCATFISRKLCEHYVADPAPPKLVNDLAQVYLETGGDVSAMLVAMSQHPDFWASAGKVANPIEFGVRTARMARSVNPAPVNDLLTASGMGMFDRATPDGYPEDDGYSANSNALLQRWRFAKTMETAFLDAGLVPPSLRPADTAWSPDTTQRIVDLAAVRMTGNVLSDTSNDAAQKLIVSAPPNTDARLHALATFICQLPENSLK